VSDMDAARRAAERAHQKARLLASEEIDAKLSPADAAWLAVHLRGCAACQSVADEYRVNHDELRGLATPEPPRELWARTSAGLDAVDRRRAGRTGLAGLARLRLGYLGYLGRNWSSLASVMAVAAVVLVVGLSLLSQGPLFAPVAAASSTANVALVSAAPSSGAQTGLTMVGGNSYWVGTENGVYQIRGGTGLCTGLPDSCAITNGTGTVLGSVESKTAVSVVISPNATQAAVWNANKIVILPLAQSASAPKIVAIDLLTPRPAALASATPVAETPAAETPATTSGLTQPSASVEPGATASAAQQPAESATPAPAGPTAVPASGPQPTAILDGYQIVGRAPEFSADGQWFAFSARPVGVSSGSDVFVWRVGWAQAQAVTTSHADLFAGWFGAQILFSEFSQADSETNSTPSTSPPAAGATDTPTAAAPAAGAATVTAMSYVYDPRIAEVWQIDRPMLMPVVDPTGTFVVYWAGTVAFDQATGLYGAGQGDFYFDAWSNLNLVATQMGGNVAEAPSPAPTAAPSEAPTAAQPSDSASPLATSDQSVGSPIAPAPTGQPSSPPDASTGLPQLVPVGSVPGIVTSWSVRWDATGQYVAIWVADAGVTDIGQVTLLNVIPGSNMLNVGGLLLSASARSNIQFDDSQFVYTSPGQGGDGKTYLFQLPAVPPTPNATPEVTAPADSSGSGQPAATEPPPASTDRPGS
jgi:hypothetical protein